MSISADNTANGPQVISSSNVVDVSNISDLRIVIKVFPKHYRTEHYFELTKYAKLAKEAPNTLDALQSLNKDLYTFDQWDTLSENVQLNLTRLCVDESNYRPIEPQVSDGLKVIMLCTLEVRLDGAQPLVNVLEVFEQLSRAKRHKAVKALENVVKWVQARLMNLKLSFLSGEEVDFEYPEDVSELISADEE